MPDWFYRPVARPLLFRLPDRVARGVALGTIGRLGRSAAGRHLIDFLGHMRPPVELAVAIDGVVFPSPFGIGWRVDPELRAAAGLSLFGIGCLEVHTKAREVRRNAGDVLEETPLPRNPEWPPRDATVPILEREFDEAGNETLRLPSGRRLPVMGLHEEIAGEEFRTGVVLQAGRRQAAGGWSVPARMHSDAPRLVRAWREHLGDAAPLIVSGGVDCPADAVALIRAGATLVLVDGGLVFRGPGFIKRCNDALLSIGAPPPAGSRRGLLLRDAWPWALGLGVALSAGGFAALVLAVTRVLLPYDEHFVGLTSAMLQRSSPRLFAFMAHDRATLAGTMLGLGSLYALLAWHGVRRAVHGARTAVIASALVGFASFFSFFGFGYFDTLHAFVAVVLFQITVQVMVGNEGSAQAALVPRVDREDGAWRRAQWGQLLWIVHAVGLLIAGATILFIGMTSVFVSEDVAFLCVTAEQARGFDNRLVSVVAHDRATLGGMLLATGVASLLPMLWCFRQGAAWLWTGMLALGLPAYAAALGVHFWVGYTDPAHLVPAFIGLALWAMGLVCARSYLVDAAGDRKST